MVHEHLQLLSLLGLLLLLVYHECLEFLENLDGFNIAIDHPHCT